MLEHETYVQYPSFWRALRTDAPIFFTSTGSLVLGTLFLAIAILSMVSDGHLRGVGIIVGVLLAVMSIQAIAYGEYLIMRSAFKNGRKFSATLIGPGKISPPVFSVSYEFEWNGKKHLCRSHLIYSSMTRVLSEKKEVTVVFNPFWRSGYILDIYKDTD